MYVIAMIAIIIGGDDLFEEAGATELAREAVGDGEIRGAARVRASEVVLLDAESPAEGGELVNVDGEPGGVQARAAALLRAVHVRAGVAHLRHAERRELRRDLAERDRQPAVAHERRVSRRLVADAADRTLYGHRCGHTRRR